MSLHLDVWRDRGDYNKGKYSCIESGGFFVCVWLQKGSANTPILKKNIIYIEHENNNNILKSFLKWEAFHSTETYQSYFYLAAFFNE